MAKHLSRRDAGDRGGQRRPKCPPDYDEIARVLSSILFEDKKPVVLSGRACKERMNGLISKYLEEDRDFTQNYSFSRQKTSTPC